MRTILRTATTTVLAVESAADQFGAGHVYEIHANAEPLDENSLLCRIAFQAGPVKEHGVNGVQHIDLLAIIRDRLDGFQTGLFASPANEVTAGFVSAAIASDETRTRRRMLAGTEGTSKA